MLSSLATVTLVPYVGLSRRSPHKAAVLHTNGFDAPNGSLFSGFSKHASGADGPKYLHVGAHFQVKNDGSIEQYCTAPWHRTLTADLRWVAIGDLQVGDALIAFDETPVRGNRRLYRRATVERVTWAREPVWEVALSNGDILTVTAEHRWLVGANELRWQETRTFTPLNAPYLYRNRGRTGNTLTGIRSSRGGRTERFQRTRVGLLIPPWEEATTRDAGWLAGIMDGEGCLGSRHQLSIAQRPGPVLDRIIELLEGASKRTRVQVVDNAKNDCQAVYVTGKLAERLALLGATRPVRLIAKVQPEAFGAIQRYEPPYSVLSIRPAGEQDIVKVSTSSGTLIVDGYPMHNCDTDLSIGHAWDANSFAIGIETEDDGHCRKRWTDAQVDSIVALLFELGVPPKLLVETPSDGVGWHRQYDSWNLSGHSCPCTARQLQVTSSILPGLEEEMSKSNEYFEQLEKDGVDPRQYSTVVRFQWGYQRGLRKRPLGATDAQDDVKMAGFEHGAKAAAARRTPEPSVPTPPRRGARSRTSGRRTVTG
jgi:hypothetical protein